MSVIDIGISDVCAGWPGIGPYAARQAGHGFLGVLAAFMPYPMRLVIFGVWIGKELFADMAGCGLSALVALDSAADLGFAVLGFIVAREIKTKSNFWPH